MAEPSTPSGISKCLCGCWPGWRHGWRWAVITSFIILATAAGILRVEGRSWWCACGQPNLWAGDIWSPHNSQHLFDPYSLTHVLHGIILWGLLAWLCPQRVPSGRWTLAMLFEAGWEIVENSSFVIERYRAATMALGYQGDSAANSIGDILACALGIAIARRLGFWGSAALFLATEGLLLWWIRDDLLLNVIMLLYPIDAVKAWQMAH